MVLSVFFCVSGRSSSAGSRPPANTARTAAGGGALSVVSKLRGVLGRLEQPYTGETATPSEAARAVAETMEALAADRDGGLGELWNGPAGEAAGVLFSALIAESAGLPEVTRAGFSEFLDSLLAAETVRAGSAAHPRLMNLGVMEAPLVR